MSNYVQLICRNCDIDFEREYKKRNAQFCSKGCATSYRQEARDPNFLEEPNELSAYLVGFILTDGSISKQEGKKKRMTLANTDYGIMKKLHPVISPNRKLYVREMKKEEHNTIYSLVNTNKDALKILDRLGIKPRKSLTVGMPKIPEELERHFIRGVFDGDGSISIMNVERKYKYKKVSITSGSKNFSYSLRKLLIKNGFNARIHKDHRYTHDVHYVTITTSSDVVKFGEWMYGDANWYIERKRNRFLDDIV